MDLSGFEDREDLKYHCFLCKECTKVCPLNIDGPQIAMKMRLEETRGSKLKERGYSLLVLEKYRYKFKSWTKGKYDEVIFPGCNFTSLYPKTIDRLKEISGEVGVGFANDCCGKPIYELGLQNKADEILKDLNRELKYHGVKSIISLCPNCYHYFKKSPLKDAFNIKSIYEALKDWERKGLLEVNRDFIKDIEGWDIYLPCPDKINEEILGHIKDLVAIPNKRSERIQCCGLGGGAYKKDKEVIEDIKEAIGGTKNLISYCATCIGQFKKYGLEKPGHILSYLLGLEEGADINNSLINRLKRNY